MIPPRASRLRAFAAKLRGFLGGEPPDTELDDEIQEHLRLLTERFVAEGLSREEAATKARRQFGNRTLLKEDRRGLQTLLSVEAWWHDLRYAQRTLWRSRGFAAVSVLTLGLGIGAATAIFSVIQNVLLAPFPYQAAERMVFPRIVNAQENQPGGRQGYKASEVLEIAETNQVFDGITAASGDAFLYRDGEGTELLSGARVTPGTFEFFGMPALHGRLIQPSDHEPGAPPVFVMRHKTWVQRFGGDLGVLNRSFALNGVPRTLVGIMPPRFGWYGADILVPERLTREATPGSAGAPPSWFVLGRLKPGVSARQAEADLTVIAQRLAALHPRDYPKHFTIQARRLGDTVVSRIQATLYTVLAAVGLLLLIACSNVANLMLARATARQKEFALRAALGAGRTRLVRLLMAESLTLALAGALLGIFLAWGGLKAVVAAMPQGTIPSESVIELNAPVLAFTLAVAVLTAVLFGLTPALQASRRELTDPLRDSGKGVSGGFRGRRLRDAVVVLEVALSLTLLIGAGLLMRSFVALREVHLGLRADHVFETVLPLPADRYATAQQETALFGPLLDRLKAVPGVVEAAVSSGRPTLAGAESEVEIAGKAPEERRRSQLQLVSEGYFQVLRMALREGRLFTEAEVDNARRVAVVNETFRRRFLPDESPSGKRLRLARLEGPGDSLPDPWFEIVGVVSDVTNRGLQMPIEPEVWVPRTIAKVGFAVLLVRTSQDPGNMLEAVRREVWATDSGVALANSGTLESRINEQLYAGPRFGFLLMTIFGCIGLMLVTMGVYGVLAYSTVQKTHEIGIRMALGAERADVLGMIVATGLRLVGVGIALGMAVSLGLGRLIKTQLVGVTAYDPLTLATTTLVLTLTAAVACWIPARGAARVDPTVALRYE